MFKKPRSSYGVQILKKRALRTAAVGLALALTVGGLVRFLPDFMNHSQGDRTELLRLWSGGDYPAAYALSRGQLETKPLDAVMLTIHGFSAYQLATTQLSAQDRLAYIDQSIWSLRKALLIRSVQKDPRALYVLGKAYYHKGPSYADLAVRYLEASRKDGFSAADLAEYLGLSYAAKHDFRRSVAAFSLALEPGATEGAAEQSLDLLLLAMARSYIALNEHDSARPYLIRCAEESRDSIVVAQARLLLGSILAQSGDLAGAEAEYFRVTQLDGQNAEAHFQLGELYDKTGDTVKARSEWRKTIRIDPTHGPARSRLSM
jgi:Flp pilus assembly protein TadD